MYTIKKIQIKEINSFTWDDIDSINICNYPWDTEGYKPKTKAQLFYTEEDIRIKFTSCESKVRIAVDEINGPVYHDSCVEFFFMPDKKKSDCYFNIEVNAAGIYLLQVGPLNMERELIYDLPSTILDIKAEVTKENVEEYNDFKPWTIEYKIPFLFIKKYVSEFEPKSGHVMLGNVYKCGSKTEHNHYGCWKNIEYHKPSFHRPEFFGKMILE